MLPTAFAESEPETVVFEGFLPMRIFEGRGDSEPEAYAAKEKEIIDAIGVKPVALWCAYRCATRGCRCGDLVLNAHNVTAVTFGSRGIFKLRRPEVVAACRDTISVLRTALRHP